MNEVGAARAALESDLADLRRGYVDRYGDDLTTLWVDWVAGRPRVAGSVVVAKQLRTLQRASREWFEGHGAIELDVVVLAELPDRAELLDGRHLEHPGAGAVPIWDRRQGGRLATEWLEGDGPARILRDAEPRRLAQLADGTVGWCEVEASRPLVPGDDAPEVVRRLPDGGQQEVSVAHIEAIVVAARRWVERRVPYRLGGRDPGRGLDCSAFVQGLIAEQTGALLPRHTTDQMRVGHRVGRSDIRAGDLVFARARSRNWMHVGLALDGAIGGERPIAHACRVDEAVRVEPLAGFLERYRYLRTQRILRLGLAATEAT